MPLVVGRCGLRQLRFGFRIQFWSWPLSRPQLHLGLSPDTTSFPNKCFHALRCSEAPRQPTQRNATNTFCILCKLRANTQNQNMENNGTQLDIDCTSTKPIHAIANTFQTQTCSRQVHHIFVRTCRTHYATKTGYDFATQRLAAHTTFHKGRTDRLILNMSPHSVRQTDTHANHKYTRKTHWSVRPPPFTKLATPKKHIEHKQHP